MRKLIVLLVGLFITEFGFAQNNVGIGTTNPSSNAILHLENSGSPLGLLLPNVDFTTLTPLASEEGMMIYDHTRNSIFFWNGSSWDPIVPGWTLNGNTGTNSGTNFIGTTDAQDLNFRTNNLQRLNISGATGYLGINALADASSHMYVFRSAIAGSGDFGAGRSNVHAYRAGGSIETEGGTGWSYGAADVAILGTSFWGNNFTAGVAGYNFNDYVNSTAVLGAQYNASYWGALAHNDASGATWGVYTPNNAYTGGSQTINGSVLVGSSGVLSFGGVAVLNQIGSPNDIYANIRVLRNSSATLQDGMYIGYASTGGAAADLRFYANGTTERMRIDAGTGYVGIGTTNPIYPLDVQGRVAIYSGLNGDPTIRGTGGAAWTRIGANGFGLAFWGNNNVSVDNVPQMFFSSAGNLSIGTTAANGRLHVEGALWQQNGYTTLAPSLDNSLGNLGVGVFGFNNAKIRVSSNQLFSIYSDATAGNYAIYTVGIAAGNIDWAVASDRRFKKDIVPISNAIDLVKNLDGVRYNYDKEAFPEKKFPEKAQVGLIAQDVNQILPEVVNIDNEGYYSIGYGSIVPVLIEAIKEQQTRIEELEKLVKGN